MVEGVDHVVIAVAGLDRAIAGFDALGFTVVKGRSHAQRGKPSRAQGARILP